MPGFRLPRNRRDERPRRRGFNALWAFFWLIVLIIVLGLLFGGYRKGTPIHNPGSWMRAAAEQISSTR
ncbi:hypothetical protein KDL01_02955 [Actinospica durhamensis]|uniref:Uncharacterized protein n=1 Tax=Actinospica durhamensis TaxID=1508375 RepID=A0A941EIV9_9ACTN|nr:hypothetical protein [Actinospica durhamensis]MBR7832201.1 hypothetical protein [Actinospica durhamensis]